MRTEDTVFSHRQGLQLGERKQQAAESHVTAFGKLALFSHLKKSLNLAQFWPIGRSPFQGLLEGFTRCWKGMFDALQI